MEKILIALLLFAVVVTYPSVVQCDGDDDASTKKAVAADAKPPSSPLKKEASLARKSPSKPHRKSTYLSSYQQ
ncbi:unnamed protein product [Trichobilharzia regenti]|nr:unnamed protein product [Trichobilharzia regenti]